MVVTIETSTRTSRADEQMMLILLNLTVPSPIVRHSACLFFGFDLSLLVQVANVHCRSEARGRGKDKRRLLAAYDLSHTYNARKGWRQV